MRKGSLTDIVTSFLLGVCTTVCFYQLTTKGKLEIQENEVQVFFTYPKSLREINFTRCEDKIIDLINAAQETIYIQAYGWKSKNIAGAILKASMRGVQIKLLVDKTYECEFSKYMKMLLTKNIDVRIRKISGIAHNKIMIIDEKIVLTGSYNFSNSANEKNDENIIIVNNKAIAKKYLDNWNKCNSYSFPVGATEDTSLKPWENQYGSKPKTTFESKKCTDALVEDIHKAKNTIYVKAYQHMSHKIINALLEAKKRYVQVRVVTNKNHTNEYAGLNTKTNIAKNALELKKSWFIIDKNIMYKINDIGIFSKSKDDNEPKVELEKFTKHWDRMK